MIKLRQILNFNVSLLDHDYSLLFHLKTRTTSNCVLSPIEINKQLSDANIEVILNSN